ncbi:MAG: sensor domain-containing diguanylate cyclase [Polyangiales bacterium]
MATSIVRAASNPEASIAELGQMASCDPAFAMRVLALVNSSFFGLAAKVSDIHQASVMLGVRGLRNVALSLMMTEMTPTSGAGEVLLSNSLRRAITAQRIAETTQAVDAGTAFTTGLLLEVSLLQLAGDAIDTSTHIANAPVHHRVLFERASGLNPHPYRGASMAQEFGLADDVVDAIRDHHRPFAPPAPLACIAWCAERFSAVFEGGVPADNLRCAHEAGAHLSLTPTQVDVILMAVPAQVAEAGALFQRSLGPQPNLDDILQNAHQSLVELNQQYEVMLRRLEATLAEKQALEASLRIANQRLEQLAFFDALTGLHNKRAFEQHLRRDWARAKRNPHPLSLIALDIDHFKRVNDTYGHPVGDEVLHMLGGIVGASVRLGDVAARVGGEEFALLLPNTDSAGARTVAERLQTAIRAAELTTPTGPLRITVSIGIACTTGRDAPTTPEALVTTADQALYHAKHTGRDRIVIAPWTDQV